MLENKIKRVLYFIVVGLILAIIIVIEQPIHTKYICLITILMLACLLIIISILFIHKIWFKISGFIIMALCLGTLINQSPINTKTLNQLYVNQLTSYKNVTYVWGGESGFGVDCSGLPRRSMINALLIYSVTRLNGNSLIQALDYWWNDASALEMLNGYKGRMFVSDMTFTINESEKVSINPGDLAVTANGTHVMVFIDSKHVIQAEPGAGMVIINNVPSENPWLYQDVKLVRWSSLNIF
jgi:hypothetical protein